MDAGIVIDDLWLTPGQTAVIADDLAQMGDDLAVVVDKADEVTEATEKSVKTAQQDIVTGGSKVDFYVTPSGDAVPSTGYRYISENAQYLDDMINSMSIPTNADGTYFSFNNYDFATPGALQVPHDASVKVSFDTLQIIDDISIPYGNWGRASYLEPITKDFPQFGLGGLHKQSLIVKLISTIL